MSTPIPTLAEADEQNFTGLNSILSGPAGGVVGYALTSWDAKERAPVIG